ncbi:MAG: hypothetical protein ACI89T_001858, partial [Cognaticolwellia sp.]
KGNNLDGVMEKLNNGEFPKGSIITLFDQSRFSRKMSFDVVYRTREMVKAGLYIHLATKNVTYTNLDSLEEFIMPLLEAEQSHKDSKIKSERTAGSYQTRLQSGMKNFGGHTPNWIKRVYDDKGKACDYSLITERVTVINKIYDMYVEGNGANAIVKWLNANVEPWGEYDSRRSTDFEKNWGESYISKILINPSVIGERTFNRTNAHEEVTISDYYPMVITKELFYRARDVRKSRGSGQHHQTKHPSVFYIGLAHCGYCHGKIIAQHQKGKTVSIRCSHNAKGQTSICAGGSSPARFLERVLIELCRDQVNYNLLFTNDKVDVSGLRVKSNNLAEEIAKIEGKLTKLEDLYFDEEINKERYVFRKGDMENRLAEIKSELKLADVEIEENTHKSTDDEVEFIELLKMVKVDDIPQSLRLRLKDLLRKFVSRIDVYRYGSHWKTPEQWENFKTRFPDKEVINHIWGNKNPFEKERINLTYNIIFNNGESRAVWFDYKTENWSFTATKGGGKKGEH